MRGQNYFPWYNPEGKIGHCPLGEVSVCGNCRLGKQQWVNQKIQTNMNGCVCLTCEICQERLILLGSKCSCVFSESKLELCNRCKKLEERRWVQTVSKKAVWLTRKSKLAMGCVSQGKIMTKIKNDANSASRIMRMTVNLCCTRGFMGIGMCIQGIHIEWKTVNKSMKERMGDWLLRKRK